MNLKSPNENRGSLEFSPPHYLHFLPKVKKYLWIIIYKGKQLLNPPNFIIIAGIINIAFPKYFLYYK
jgi:hypothetical protein